MTPTSRLLWCLLLPGISALVVDCGVPVPWLVWPVSCAILVGVLGTDFLLGWQQPALRIKRHMPRSLSVSSWTTVNLQVENRADRDLILRCRDRWPDVFQQNPEAIVLELISQQVATTSYQLFPEQRGGFSVRGLDVLVDSPWRLWRRRVFFPLVEEVRVFPDFRELGRYSLLATHHHLSQMGIKKLTRRGEGKEFHQLREYRVGDTLQQIDWKATARYQRPISKEYQDERDQQILFVLDCGRRMRHVEQGRSQFDQALNAILLLAHVAARQGDAVGLFAFGAENRWYPPRKRENTVRSLLLAMYDLESSPVSADYLMATGELLSRQHRRALMVIITNSRSEQHEDLKAMVRQLHRRHLVVVADLREQELEGVRQESVTTLTAALRYQALEHYLSMRRQLLRQLQLLGCQALDLTAAELPASLVNTYLEIKSAGKL